MSKYDEDRRRQIERDWETNRRGRGGQTFTPEGKMDADKWKNQQWKPAPITPLSPDIGTLPRFPKYGDDVWANLSDDRTNRSAGQTRRILAPRQQLTKEQVEGRFGAVLALALGLVAGYLCNTRFALQTQWVIVVGLGTALVSHLLLAGPLRIIRRVAFVLFGLAMLAASLWGFAMIVREII